MKVLLTLISYGQDNGPFDIYTNSDGFQLPFYINVSVADLLAGKTISVDDTTSLIKVVSKGNCSNELLIDLN